ncbi:hypothetical protein B5P45_00205 [Phyllobacterium zundukense]|uniref:Uncharacterized protein n=1 Tax=Phyllobacterium zundukense TaxID=1867719 RepID=A0A2N9W3F1_9HYPH|nr:hypothetical protein BLM14_11850 [Phyllobacterium zundukense]PIO46269.1 hypothetical protein B5P45_00205 [Phyllobacterium zundukense]
MRKFSITNAALWGFVVGFVCMAAVIIFTGRARNVPMAGYVIDLLGGAVAGAGSFSLLSWIRNLITRAK